MLNGISMYPGLDNTIDENLALLSKAAALGIRRIFTSLHIPETNKGAFKDELDQLLRAANRHHMEIISDISPATLDMLNIKQFRLSAFRMMGIHTLRFDYGYGAPQIAKFSRNKQNIRIQLNASTISHKFLQELIDEKANFDHIDALHNFYPRPGTGISENTLMHQTRMLHKAGIKVGAFIPSRNRRRAPLFEGLPTLETHRTMDPDLAARHLAALGMDSVFIADSLPSDEELMMLSRIRDDTVYVHAHALTLEPVQRELLTHVFTARIDEARDAIRAQESRELVGGTIPPEPPRERQKACITLDNEKYHRYMGELQIIKRPQPPDERVNVVAQVNKEEQFLLDYIAPGHRFRILLDGQEPEENKSVI